MFRALGRDDPPQRIQLDGQTWQRVDIYNHDSWPDTAIYRYGDERIVCKFNRRQWFFFIPLGWIGRWLARREARLLNRLAHVGNLPRVLGPVKVDGIEQRNAVARSFIAGHPLQWGEKLDDQFFPRINEMIAGMKNATDASVDRQKPENLIVGDDGQPYLIDFQVSYCQPDGWWWRLFRPRWFLRILQQCDRYHIQKHIIRSRPEVTADDERELDGLRPWPIRFARFFGNKFRWCRRKLLVLIGVRRGKGHSRTEVDPEDAVRREIARDEAAGKSPPLPSRPPSS